MEANLPQGYREMQSGDASWDALGMRIKWTIPEVPGESTVPMLDPVKLRVCVEFIKPVPLRELTAFAWTCMYHKDNIEGVYKDIPLAYDPSSRKWDDHGVTTYEFGAITYPTHNDEFRLTFNVRYLGNLVWANKKKIDNMVTVTLPRDINEWTRVPASARIADNLYIGNYLAVLLAEEMYFDAVLTLQAGIEGGLAVSRVVKMVKTEILPIGAGMEIPPEKIQRIVSTLKTMSHDYVKVLVGDKEGLGRAGSSLTSYIFANNPNLTFEEAYKLVQKKKTIYCHRGLDVTLNRLFPRD